MTVQHRLTAFDLPTTMTIEKHNSYYREGITHICNTPRNDHNLNQRGTV